VLSPSLSVLTNKPINKLLELCFYLSQIQLGGSRSSDDDQVKAARHQSPIVAEPGTHKSLNPISVMCLADFSRYGQPEARVFSLGASPGDNKVTRSKGTRMISMPLILTTLADPQLAREPSVQIYFFQVPTARRLRPR
jgi:hypothetical protein